MKKLIVNADDYGDHPEASLRIRKAHLSGIVTSATLLMSSSNAEDAIRTALRECPDLGLGVHLRITQGLPLLPADKVRSLIGPEGGFPDFGPFLERLERIEVSEAKSEWREQIERFIAVRGGPPDHLDSHHHSSYLTPGLMTAMLELAEEFGCPIRRPFNSDPDDGENGLPGKVRAIMTERVPALVRDCGVRWPDMFFSSFYDATARTSNLMEIIGRVPEGVSELMTHPGKIPGLDRMTSNDELAALTDPGVRRAIASAGVELVSFRTAFG
jgi:predicted glycoside hydrolase/deacetylase ChbG (UPF0249 family)